MEYSLYKEIISKINNPSNTISTINDTYDKEEIYFALLNFFRYKSVDENKEVDLVFFRRAHQVLGDDNFKRLFDVNSIAFYPYFTEDTKAYIKRLSDTGIINPPYLTSRKVRIDDISAFLSKVNFTGDDAIRHANNLLDGKIKMDLHITITFPLTRLSGFHSKLSKITEGEFQNVFYDSLVSNPNLDTSAKEQITKLFDGAAILQITLDDLMTKVLCREFFRDIDYPSDYINPGNSTTS